MVAQNGGVITKAKRRLVVPDPAAVARFYQEGVFTRLQSTEGDLVLTDDRRPVRIAAVQLVLESDFLGVGERQAAEGEGEVVLRVGQPQRDRKPITTDGIAPGRPVRVLEEERKVDDAGARGHGIHEHLARVEADGTSRGTEPQGAVRIEHARVRHGLDPREAFCGPVGRDIDDLLLQLVQLEQVETTVRTHPEVLVRIEQELADAVTGQAALLGPALCGAVPVAHHAGIRSADPDIVRTVHGEAGDVLLAGMEDRRPVGGAVVQGGCVQPLMGADQDRVAVERQGTRSKGILPHVQPLAGRGDRDQPFSGGGPGTATGIGERGEDRGFLVDEGPDGGVLVRGSETFQVEDPFTVPGIELLFSRAHDRSNGAAGPQALH